MIKLSNLQMQTVLDGAVINADFLQELREIKKETAEFHQNVLKFLQRRDERAKRKEQLATNKYKLLEQFIKQRERKRSPGGAYVKTSLPNGYVINE